MTRTVLGVFVAACAAGLIACGGGGNYLPPADPSATPRPPAGPSANGEYPRQPDPGPVIRGVDTKDWFRDAVALGYRAGTGFEGPLKLHWVESSSPAGDRSAWTSGPTWQEVAEIRAIAKANGDDADALALEFFRLLVGLRYEGADPERARRWIDANVGKTAAVVIGGARLETAADGPKVRLLRMVPPETDPRPLVAQGFELPKPKPASAKPAKPVPEPIDDEAEAKELAGLLAAVGPLDDAEQVGAYLPRLNDFVVRHPRGPAGQAARKEAAALAKLRLVYLAAEKAGAERAGTASTSRLREIIDSYPGTLAASAAESCLSEIVADRCFCRLFWLAQNRDLARGVITVESRSRLSAPESRALDDWRGEPRSARSP